MFISAEKNPLTSGLWINILGFTLKVLEKSVYNVYINKTSPKVKDSSSFGNSSQFKAKEKLTRKRQPKYLKKNLYKLQHVQKKIEIMHLDDFCLAVDCYSDEIIFSTSCVIKILIDMNAINFCFPN